MAEPQSSKNTTILINSDTYDALISSTRPEITSVGDKMYNYNGTTLLTGGNNIEYGNITLVFAEYEYDRLRSNLVGGSDDGVPIEGTYPMDMSGYKFVMDVTISPSTLLLHSQKSITYSDCCIIGVSYTDVVYESNYYTVSVTISVGNVKETRLN